MAAKRIYEKAYEKESYFKSNDQQLKLTIQKITKVLELKGNEKLTPAFIAYHCKDIVQPELNYTQICRVLEFHLQWIELLSKKRKMLRLYKALQAHIKKEENKLFRLIGRKEIEQVEAINSLEGVNERNVKRSGT